MPRTPFIEPLEARIAPATLSIADASIVEGNSGIKYMTFTVTLDTAQSDAVVVHYKTANGTATVADHDYKGAADGLLQIAAGSKTGTIKIAVYGDTKAEKNETFSVTLSNASDPSNASNAITISNATATGTIINDDPTTIAADGKSLTYTDTDGDVVTVNFSKSILTAKNVAKAFTFVPSYTTDSALTDVDMQLQSIDLSKLPGVKGSDLNISVTTPGDSGDGVVNVGQIIGNVNMGTVTVVGDLGRFVLGSGTGQAFKTLQVDSLGAVSGTGASNIASSFSGNAGTIDVIKNVENSTLVFDGKLADLEIGGQLGTTGSASGASIITINGTLVKGSIGSIVGGTDGNSGEITGGSKSSVTDTLTVGSITGGGSSSGVILIHDINDLKVTNDITGGTGDDSGKVVVGGTLTTLNVGGKIKGEAGDRSGEVYAGTLGTATVTGSITAGAGDYSGGIFAGSITTKLSVGAVTGETGETTTTDQKTTTVNSGLQAGIIYVWGNAAEIDVTASVTGGEGSESGSIEAGSIDTLSIGGSVIGGSGTKTGRIYTSGNLGVAATTTSAALATPTTGTVTIGGNVSGSTGDDSGEIMVGGTLSQFTLSGDLVGGNNLNTTGAVFNTGYIQAAHIGDLTIGGNVNVGTDSGGGLDNSGAIRATYEINSITVDGSLEGSATNAVIISAGGQQHVDLKASTPSDIAINSVTIKGSMSYAEILAGYSTDATASNHRGSAVSADAQIGTVTVKQDFTGSSIVAGATPGGDTYFGNSGTNVTDTKITSLPDYSKIVSSIASVIIGGTVSSGTGTSYGIVAQQVIAVSVRRHECGLDRGCFQRHNAGRGWLHQPQHPGGRPMKNQPMIFIEPLESRIAPATLVDANTVTWTDVDGDLATLHLSKGILTSSNVSSVFDFNTGSVNGSNSTQQQLDVLDLTALGSLARHVNITVTAETRPGGDGEVDIGLIRAAIPDASTFQFNNGIDLGTVKIQGDLGAIYAGDNYADRALQKLQVDSFGALNSTLQAQLSDTTSTLYTDLNNGSLQSLILASVGNIDIKGNFDGSYGASLRVLGGVFSNIGNVTIGGSMIGATVGTFFDSTDATNNTGQIFFMHSIGKVTIGGDLIGGDGTGSGTIEGYDGSTTTAGKITVGGSIKGGSGASSGGIFLTAGYVNGVSVGGDLLGGTNSDTGEIRAISLGTVSIGGSVAGDTTTYASSSGYISGKVSSLAIGGDISAGLGDSSGEVKVGGTLSSATVGGSIIGGSASEAGALFISGSVKTLTINGYLEGGSGDRTGYLNVSGNAGTVLIGKDATSGDSLLGGSGSASGQLYVSGNLKTLTLDGSIVGGSGSASGQLQVAKDLTTCTINGSIIGGSNSGAGELRVNGSLTTLTLNGSITGGTSANTGVLFVSGSLKSLNMSGSLVGGSVSTTGLLIVDHTLGTATIQGNITGGGNADATASLDETGFLLAGIIEDLTVNGNITAGNLVKDTGDTYKDSTFTLTNSGAIRAGGEIVKLTVNGNLTGTTDCAVTIGAVGHTSGNVSKVDTAIGQLTIGTSTGGGDVTYANILAGYAPATSSVYGTAKDADASIGAVTINGSMSGTNIVAGAAVGSGAHFGASGNTLISGTDRANLTATIASVIVKGQVNSTSASGDGYGIVSQLLKGIEVNGTALVIAGGAGGVTQPVAINGSDTSFLEVS
ncbi:MAG: Calx-beta domain-containing protein [Chthoniobacteraceae bacterium]